MKRKKSIVSIICTLVVMLCSLVPSLTLSAAGSFSELAREERIYVGNYKEIWAINVNTGNIGLVRKSTAKAKDEFNNLQRNKNYIYYDGGEAKSSTAGVYRYDLDRKKEYKIADGQSPIVYKNKVCYVSFKKNSSGKKVISGISTMNLNGGNKKLVLSTSDTNLKFTVNGGKIYYIAKDNKTLYQVDFQGKAKKKLASLDTKKAIYITSDRNCVYIKCNYGNHKIYYQYNIKTKKAKVVAEEDSRYRILGFDGNYFYDYGTTELFINDFVNGVNGPLDTLIGTYRNFEKILTYNSKYIVCETSYYSDGYKHTLSVFDRTQRTFNDIIPDIK